MLAKQRIQTSVRIVILLIAAVAILAGARALPVLGASAANTLKVSPVRSDIEVNPGESTTVQVTVNNLTNETVSVRPIMNDFIQGDESGTPSLILNENEYAPTHSLKRFIVPMSDVILPAKGATTFKVVIKVPSDAQAGGYFGAVRFAPSSPSAGGQVNLSASVASLILLTVPGDLVEKLSMTDFDIRQGDKPGTFFRSANDLNAHVRFASTGNVQVGPFGKVSVTQGDKIVYEADFNDKTPRDVILPDGARQWDIPLKNIGTFGNYTVKATFSYGKSNETIEVTKSFWVIPLGVIIATIAGVLVLVGLIIGIWLFLRSYKRRILRGSRGGRR